MNKHELNAFELISDWLSEGVEDLPDETPVTINIGGRLVIHDKLSDLRSAISPLPSTSNAESASPSSQMLGSPIVSVKTMRLSDGRADYFVSIKVGNREVTPHVFREEYKAAYHVALYSWLLNGTDKPDLMAFDEDDWPAQATEHHVTLADYATRLFDLRGFMLLETYRDKPAVTVTFPNLEEAQQFHNALVELSTHRPRPQSLADYAAQRAASEGSDNG